MTPGPSKNFDPREALTQARDLFWRQGYDGTGIRDLEEALGIGRKSLYDTFGSKRELFLAALANYTETIIGRIRGRLEHPEGSAYENLRQALQRLGQYHASDDSSGCLLGVAMGQVQPEDEELRLILATYLKQLERSFETALARGIEEGSIHVNVSPRDSARNLVALVQGMALLGRIGNSPSTQRSIVQAALAGLEA